MTVINLPHRRLAVPFLVLTAALGAPAAGWAEPVQHVFTWAQAGVAGNNTAVACYNVGCDVTAPNTTGPQVTNGPQPNGVAVAQSGGAFDGSSTTQGSGVTVRGATAGNPWDYFAQADASVDMASGKLHAATSNNGKSSYYTEAAGGAARAQMLDTVTFTRGPSQSPSHIGVSFSVDGAIHTTGQHYQGSVEATLILPGVGAARALFGVDPSYGVAAQFDTSSSAVWGTWSWSQPTPSSWEGTFQGDFVMDEDLLVLPLNMLLDVNCAYGASCDFGNTAKVSFSLPSDVRMTSASGVLLTAVTTDPGNSVPEPASIALMLAALGAAGAASRARRR